MIAAKKRVKIHRGLSPQALASPLLRDMFAGLVVIKSGNTSLRKIALVLFLFVSAPFASADGLYDKCMADSDGTNVAFGTCGGEWIARADAKLNAIWKDIYPDMLEASKTDILAEQRLWNAYKDKSCSYFANGDFGREGQVIHFPACRAQAIELRIKQLEQFRDGEY